MSFTIKKGIAPKEIKAVGIPGPYDIFRNALKESTPYEWMHVDVDERTATLITNAISNTNTRTARMLSNGRYKVEARIRFNHHDRTIPIGTARVFFRKVLKGE